MKVDYDDLLISRAINDSVIIVFKFKGGIRKVEPHIIFYGKETGIKYLLAFQVSSSSTSASGWKCFTLYNIYNVILQDESFIKKSVSVPKWGVVITE